MPDTLQVLDIIPGTIVDGPGLRTSIYFAGCTHACPGCHNPQSHDPEGGTVMTVEQLLEVVEREGFNVTFSGGDPMLQARALLPLAQGIHALGLNIWCYTGYTFEQLQRIPAAAALLPYIDTLVDGPFIQTLAEPTLPFRGSSNQRIIKLSL